MSVLECENTYFSVVERKIIDNLYLFRMIIDKVFLLMGLQGNLLKIHKILKTSSLESSKIYILTKSIGL